MSDRLPPLTALRAFEAAARHLSFARAADELGVTPAALSFQIKSLEDHLGAPVFHRLNRAVELTELGAMLSPGVTDGFDALQVAWRAARRRLDSASLTVTAGPAFTAKWLAPRLFSFAQEHPEIELRFSAGLRLVDFTRDDVDVAIRFGQSADPNLYTREIITEWMAPMVTPELARTITKPEDLLNLPLIGQDDISFLRPPANWSSFFDALGVEGEIHGPRFSQADHAIDTALSGAGAVLGRLSLTESHLREGRLVIPVPYAMQSGGSYRLVCPKGAEDRPQIAQFMDWVTRETAGIDAYSQDLTFVNI